MNRAEARLRTRSRNLQRITSGTLVTLVSLLVLELFGPHLVSALHGAPADQVARGVALSGASAVAAPFYLFGLWHVRCALGALADGGLFAAAAAIALNRVGWSLAIGALVGIVVTPTLSKLMGADPGYLLALDVSAVVLAMIGLAFVLFADLFRRAEKLQAQMREII